MLAICSDLDETRGFEDYLEIARYLNTHEQTRIGKGLGLEVGNTMYFDMPPGELSFWNVTDEQRTVLVELMKSGHIDAFHSFGDLADSRAHCQRALQFITANNCRLKVWIDHATAPSNLGSDIMQGEGDEADAPAYHADLTIAHGVEYVWRGRVTSVIGQGVRRRLAGIFSWKRPWSSMITTAKEFAKGLLGRLPGSRFSLHASNKVMEAVRLRDGQPALEFLRSSPHPCGVSSADRGDRLYEVLNSKNLDLLESRRGTAIIYTHLGKTADPGTIFPNATIQALRDLRSRSDRQAILVATTVRTLDYHRMLSELDWEVVDSPASLSIHCSSKGRGLEGLTFVVTCSKPVRVVIDGELAPIEKSKLSDDTYVVCVPWTPLTFPSVS